MNYSRQPVPVPVAGCFSRTMRTLLFLVQAAALIAVTVCYAIAVIIVMLLLGKRVFFPFARSWSRMLLLICGIRVQSSGFDVLPRGVARVYVSNHQSLFDIPVLLATLPDDAAIMYKRELEKIPVFGWSLRWSPFIAVTRDDPRNAMASIEEAADSIKKGGSVIIFPEGTRSEDGALGTFKRGAIALAVRAGRPIVPLAIIGTNAILPKKSLRFNSGTVRLLAAEPVSVPEVHDRTSEKALLLTIRSTIEDMMLKS